MKKYYNLILAFVLLGWVGILLSTGQADTVQRIIQVESSTNPTVSATGYAFNQQLGKKFLIGSVTAEKGGYVSFSEAHLIDRSNSGQPLDILLFDDEPQLASTDGQALNISEAQLNAHFVGQLNVVAGDWRPATGASVAQSLFSSSILHLKHGSTGVWGVMRSRGTPTFTGTNDLQISFTVRTF